MMTTAESSGCKCSCGGKCGDACKCKPKGYTAIAIDGPCGAGKTTLAKMLAERLQFVYVDTGALYRAFAVHKLWLLKGDWNVDNAAALRTFSLDFRYVNGEQIMELYGENINQYLRTEQVSMEASNVSADPAVREALLEYQRRQALAYNVVMEGRDIGTVVLPDAQVKIFLTASLSTRANRRFKELVERGESPDFCSVMDAIRTRDWQDTTRATAPLKETCDAYHLDNTNLTIEQTVEEALVVVRAKVG